ncbi:MAG TPA: hypothetical protein VGS03_00330 [Candidatus Polarisedimenticolia bacterium]|nr:hypothetical protein [Candidatus Polarisedimenticolia bacterium]
MSPRRASRRRAPGLKEVARDVAIALEREGLRAVLTGGACASLYAGGAYQSSDLDFILLNVVHEDRLKRAMGSIGFAPRGGHFVRPGLPFFVEFPKGPLAIGRDVRIEPVLIRIRGAGVPALSATDACRDRLAAFYHWGDRGSLKAAVAIARRNRVDLKVIRVWSEGEEAVREFGDFLELVQVTRRG